MALHKVAVAAKDGATSPAAIPGGIQQHDTSGTGAGPNDPLVILVDSTGNEVLGTTADAAATTSDATPITFMQAIKQISKSIQAAAASLATLVSDGATSTAGNQTSQITQETAINTVLGTKADAKASTSDATAISAMSVWKQISFSIQAAAASLATLVSSTSPAGQQIVADATTVVAPVDFKAYPKGAGQTAQLIGAAGAAGDWLDGIMVIPGTTSPGAVSYQDGAGTAVVVFAGGASSVGDLKPFYIPIGAAAVTGWKFTTGSNVTAIFYGKHT